MANPCASSAPTTTLPLKGGECLGRLIEGTAHDAHIVGIAQSGNKGRLVQWVPHLADQMGPPETAAQAMLGAGEEVFEGAVGALDYCHDSPPWVAHQRVAAEVPAIAVRIVQQEVFGRVRLGRWGGGLGRACDWPMRNYSA